MTAVARPKKTALILAQRIVRDIDRLKLGPGDKLPPEKLMMEQYDAGRAPCASHCATSSCRACSPSSRVPAAGRSSRSPVPSPSPPRWHCSSSSTTRRTA